MERSREYDDIAVALAELRPQPRPDFTAELDELAATGFRHKPWASRRPLGGLTTRLRSLSPQRLVFTTGGTALAVIAIATVVIASTDSGARRAANALDSGQRQTAVQPSAGPAHVGQAAKPSASGSGGVNQASAAVEGRDSSGVQFSAAPPQARGVTPSLVPSSPATHREIERSAEIGLLADPADVADDSAKVFSAVHEARGIVLHSTTTAGRHAGAHFDLLIPSARLGDALAAFSAIDEVRARHEATTDITAPTVAVGEQLQDSQAKVDGLLAQLATTESEAEREAIEIELSRERRHAAALRAHLDMLHRRADYSRVSLRIEAGFSASGPGGGWGIDDAFHDAGHILGIAAGVTLIALAVLAPLALLALMAWLARRTWLRWARSRTLA